MQPPRTRYAERDGISIAYQVVGEGPFDLLLVPGFMSHLDLAWADPGMARFLGRLASFSRLILFDKPGTGLSDPIPALPTIEDRAADIAAVLDAAGSSRASLLAFSEGGPASVVLAAANPERVRSLVLYGTFPCSPQSLSPEEVAALPAEHVASVREVGQMFEQAFDRWGEGLSAEIFAPSLNDVQRRFYATFERAAASPRMARALIEAVEDLDVRDVLPAVQAPTLVLARTGDRMTPPSLGRLLASGVPDARFVELPGEDHAFWFGDFGPIIDEMERFLTGAVSAAEPDRVLATVLFTDIVASTERAAELGDRAWREVLERHDALVRDRVAASGGRVVKHIGDGALSTFDGPARAVRCAEELVAGAGELGVELRAGVHTGECERIGDDLGGLAVHIGARVGARAEPGQVLVSSTVKDLVVGSGMRFGECGEHELKGVPGRWRLYALGDERPASPPDAPLDAATDHMRLADRVTVTLARRAPGVLRLGARLGARGG